MRRCTRATSPTRVGRDITAAGGGIGPDPAPRERRPADGASVETGPAGRRGKGLVEGIIGALAAFIVATISAAGYAGVALLMAIESACIPLPSEIIMPFAGYLASTGRFTLVMAATAGAVGCNLGSAVAYEIGRHGGRPLVERWGSYILLGRHDIELADRFFARWGSIAVLVARLLPVVRTFIALPAGLAAMSRWRFHVYPFVGSWPWC